VAPKDRVVIAFCFYNLNGFVDLDSLEWAPPQFARIDSNMVSFMSYNRDKEVQRFNPRQVKHMKIICDVDRICDVEDSVNDWIIYDPVAEPYQLQTLQIPIEVSKSFYPYFEVLAIFYNESDHHYCKKILRAIKPSFNKRVGSTTNFDMILQFDEVRRFSLSILPRDAPIINEVRRKGIIFDRNKREEEV
jgi:hypothetical protein